MMQEIKAKNTVNLTTIQLHNFNHEVINELLSDTLCTHPMESYSLAALILKKTKGNPFFVKQFLVSLFEQKLLYFCYEERKWKWDSCIFGKTNVADNILDLLCIKISKLDDSTQQVIKVASCLGNSFPLLILKLLVSHDVAVKNALATGLIIKSKESDTIYRFAHDQIQQAAFSLIP